MAEEKFVSRSDSVNGVGKMKPRAELLKELEEVARVVASHQKAKLSPTTQPQNAVPRTSSKDTTGK